MELSVVPELAGRLPLKGKVVTGDALYTQRELCEKVIRCGGDYLFTVKRNQPRLYTDIALLFAQPPCGESFAFGEEWSRHGDRREIRRLWASSALTGYLDWPGARQVCKIEREIERKGQKKAEIRYAITSLGLDVGAGRLLKLVRGHWAIENRLHWVRDVTLGEDGSQARKGAGQEVMAALRNTVLGLLRQVGATNIAGALRENGWRRNSHLINLLLRPCT